MNCRELEQDLALAASGCLDSVELVSVQTHCRSCSTCAARLAEFESIARAQFRVARQVEALPIPCHARSATHPPTPPPDPSAFSLSIRWGASAAVAMVVAMLLLFRQKPPRLQTIAPETATEGPAISSGDYLSPPSLAAYRNALREVNGAALDDLLSRQERHLLPSASDPEFRATQREL